MIPQEPIEKHDVQVEDGRYVYKATIVKNIFCSEPMSRDRLRKVRGTTKYTNSAENSTEHNIDTGWKPSIN